MSKALFDSTSTNKTAPKVWTFLLLSLFSDTLGMVVCRTVKTVTLAVCDDGQLQHRTAFRYCKTLLSESTVSLHNGSGNGLNKRLA